MKWLKRPNIQPHTKHFEINSVVLRSLMLEGSNSGIHHLCEGFDPWRVLAQLLSSRFILLCWSLKLPAGVGWPFYVCQINLRVSKLFCFVEAWNYLQGWVDPWRVLEPRQLAEQRWAPASKSTFCLSSLCFCLYCQILSNPSRDLFIFRPVLKMHGGLR